jgi:hypothetical protein
MWIRSPIPDGWAKGIRHHSYNILTSTNSHSLLPRSVRSQQQLKIALSAISQLTHQTLHLRKELDELHTSSVAHYFDLEERFTAHVTRYNELPENHAQLSRKHDHLLAIAMNLCEELGVHAERLVELDFWKMAEQDKYVDTHVQSEMQIGLPSPPSTPVASTGAAKKCRLVLRLPSRPAVDEGDAGEWECVDSAYESEPEERKDGKHEADLRKRKRKSVGIADERKTSLNDASRVIKRAKKCHG